MVKNKKRKILLIETKNFIKKNVKTYLAQIIIIMLGVGFFVGMKVSTIDLQYTMTKFVEENVFYDVKVNLEYGIEQADVDELKKVIKEVKYVEGAYSLDTVQKFKGKDYIVRLHSYNPNKNINTIEIKKNANNELLGRLPKDINECVIDEKMHNSGFKIGDYVTFDSSVLNQKTLKIVGVIQSPEYLAVERGTSTTLSAKINYYVYVYEKNVVSDVYSDLYIKYNTDLEAFTNEYDEFIERKELEATHDVNNYFKDKYNEIISDTQVQLNTLKTEYQLEESKINEKFKEAENEIKDKEALLNEAKDAILSAKEIEELIKSQLNASGADLKKQLNQLKQELDIKESQLNEYKASLIEKNSSLQSKIDSNNALITQYKKQLNQKQNELKVLENNYDSALKNSNVTYTCPVWTKLNSDNTKCCYCYGNYCYSCPYTPTKTTDDTNALQYKNQINSKEKEITELNNKINNLEIENANLLSLMNADSKLAYYEKAYNDKKKEYDELNKIVNSSVSEQKLKDFYNKQNDEINKSIKQYEKEINDAKKELNDKKNEANIALRKAKNEINDKEDLLNSLTAPSSYVFVRKDNSGYSQFIADIEKINNLAIIVPIVFYGIVAFMIVASINRMLYEERSQIGTLKALGASNRQIRRKYLIYSISSVLFGSLLGIIIGIIVLPLLVYYIYEMLYEFPTYGLLFDLKHFLIASLLALVIAIFATLFSCNSTFKEKPVFLLRTKQEKNTTGSLFEKIPFLWNKLSLTSKISLKNIFRYKVRMFMTIIGIGGCLALMLTGLSLRTSITDMIPAQYSDDGIFKAHAQIFYNDMASRTELSEKTNKILKLDNVKSGIVTNFQTYTTDYEGKTASINLVTFYNEEYKSYIDLKDYKSGKILSLGNDGVYISNKIAELEGLKVGDVIKVKNNQQKEYSLVIKGIVANYIEHYVYMTDEYYQKIFDSEPRSNMLMIKLKDKNCDELEMAKKINESGIVSQILFVSIAGNFYEDIMNNLALLVAVFIIFSVLLVFAVLYNLININIRERSKEIATYKVLGFKTKKVVSIVKRENYVLLIFGVIFGVIFGSILALVVIKSVEIENLSFIKKITMKNYLISIFSTVLFTIIFSFIINRYVKKINLTESLKGNE